jgi:hypothetical protein
MRHSTSLLGFAVENLPPPLLLLSLSMSYLLFGTGNQQEISSAKAAAAAREAYCPGPGNLAAL